MKPSGVGGQAVIEGVMMRNKDVYATAVRKPNNEIAIEKGTYVSFAKKARLFQLPIFRGILSFVESMIIGTKTLTFSSSFYEDEEEEKATKIEGAFHNVFKEKAEAVITGITIVVSILLAVGIFIVLPGFIANLVEKLIDSTIILALIEGFIRILIFAAYIIAISQMKDIKRMFMYHGAEHKTINCIENGYELTVENVRSQSKQHKKCDTSFIFIVLFVSILFFIFIRVEQEWLRYLIRILLIPVIAGVSYEFIRFAGRSNSVLANILSKPGLWLQRLTTREPDDAMIEVAIQSVEAVFDWRGFLEKNKKGKKSSRNKNAGQNKKNSKKDNSTKNSTDKATVSTTKTSTKNSKEESKKADTSVNSNTVKKQNKQNEKARVEIALTVEKASRVSPKDLLDDEEDDEILRALDRYLIEKENGVDKE